MNVIFCDFDGTLDTNYYSDYNQVEEKVKILADICHTYNAKLVIEAAAKCCIDEETLEVDPDSKWVLFLFSMFEKYNIEVIGRTPEVKRYTDSRRTSYIMMWKEDEIRLFLMRHPEIEHYCVIDDDDLLAVHRKSDLDKVRNHLVTTEYYNKEHPEEEGLLPRHKEEVGKVLQKENNVRRLILKYKSGK